MGTVLLVYFPRPVISAPLEKRKLYGSGSCLFTPILSLLSGSVPSAAGIKEMSI